MTAGGERVVVAMSGGVDSSVAAALLQQQGYQVIGVTLRLWSHEEGSPSGSCCGVEGVTWARAAAEQLGISHHVIDCWQAFERDVLTPAWRDYDRGRTPSPCIRCNSAIKFGLLGEHARRRFSARWLATGHYARILERSGQPTLYRGIDSHKDQSYFLFSLSRKQLEMCLFPLGALTKPQVLDRARHLGLPNAGRSESQDSCLGLGDEGFSEALRQRFGGNARAGAILDPRGQRLGTHDGIHRFTIGQRRGLGVATGRRTYVSSIDASSGDVVISDNPEDLDAAGLLASGIVWQAEPGPGRMEAEVQIRYRHLPAAARVHRDGEDSARVLFEQPQRAVTPGQAAVFYQGQRVLGGGWIETVLKE
jgi:tRNA-specific 2-thiouridylase